MKKVRHDKMIELIREHEIETQEELAAMLAEEGFPVTQATISRDIRTLNLTKVPTGNGRQKYTLLGPGEGQAEEKYVRILREGFLSMDKAQNILVIKTVSGMAMAVAAALDALKLPEVVGCIAGDDTIMAAVRSVEDNNRLIRRISGMIGQRGKA